MPSGKAAGIDGIPAEFYKSNPYMTTEVLQSILDEAWLSKAFPEEWTEGIIVKIPKKVNLKICDLARNMCLARNLQNHLQGHTGSDKRPSLLQHRS